MKPTSIKARVRPQAGQSRPGAPDQGRTARVAAIMAGLLALVAWSHWPTLVPLFRDWWRDQDYSIGMLVPLAALYLAWEERAKIAATRLRPSWWGVGLIVAGQAVRIYGLMTIRDSIDRYGMVLTIMGLVLLVAGVQVFRRTIWILLLLFLMVPLPATVHILIAGPLQNLAAAGATVVLELMGVMADRQGTVITLSNLQQVNVEEACSGLRMLTAFVVVAYCVAYLAPRPAWQKVMLVLSSVPVAILCNVTRLVLTSLLFMAARTETAEWFFHEAGGWVMMLLAVGLLLGELWLLKRLFPEDEHERMPDGARM